MSEQFFRRVCRYRYLLWLFFQFVVVLLLLSVFSVPFLEPGSPTYYISIINFVILLVLLAASGGLAFVCERRRERKTVDAVDGRGDGVDGRGDGVDGRGDTVEESNADEG